MSFEHISHSSLTKADACLRWLYESYLAPNRIQDIASEARDRGTGFHTFAEAHFKGEHFRWNGPTTQFDEAISLFERWKRNFRIPQERWFAAERYGELHIEGLPVLIGYDDYITITGKDDGVGPIPGDLPIITDFKTGYSAEVKPEYAFQGELACARFLEEFTEYDECAWNLDFPRSGIVTPPVLVTRRDVPRIVASVKAIWARAEEAASLLTTGEPLAAAYPATPHTACGFCPARNECATRKRTETAQLIVTTPESASEALQTIALMAKSIETIKDALRPYVDANGPVSVGEHGYDFVARYNQSTSTSCDPHAVAKIVPTSEWGKALKFDTKVKDGARIQAMPEVAPLIKEGKSTTRFYVGKNKSQEDE